MDLYIFGAGASAAEGAPATRDLFAKAFGYLSPAFDDRVALVWRFLEAVFEAPVDRPDAFAALPPVDEVISLVDWSLHVDQGLGEYDPARLYQVRRAIEHLLCATLDAAQDRCPRPEEGPHARFARALADRPPGSYALLSLNYDTLLDDALLAAGLRPDYGLDRPTGGPLLLKLHGSLNWAHCAACDQIEVAREQVAHLLPRVAGLSCSRCGSRRLTGVIISPTWLKRYTLPPLARVCDLALQTVRGARRIVFAGYSLPPADVAIHQLIRRGLLTRLHRERPEIEVINHRPSAQVTERFTRLFGPDVRFDFSGFRGQV
ncbi:MAG: hypothetical protein ACOY94_27225 [Bacillota bacterium]